MVANKFRMVVLGVYLVVGALLASCSITTEVRPVTVPIPFLCIQENPDVWSKEFLPELRSQLDRHQIKTDVFRSQDPPSACSYVLKYTANWSWDLAVYLEFADVWILDVTGKYPREVARATYDARYGGLRIDKLGQTKTKLERLIDQLLGVPAPNSSRSTPSSASHHSNTPR